MLLIETNISFHIIRSIRIIAGHQSTFFLSPREHRHKMRITFTGQEVLRLNTLMDGMVYVHLVFLFHLTIQNNHGRAQKNGSVTPVPHHGLRNTRGNSDFHNEET